MAYETYTTEALVCGTFNKNTADRSYLLFTKEAGMVYADARSVREERSRQRYALQDFSSLRVSLVKGKHGWKIGSIEPQKNYYQAASSKAARGSVVSVVRLLRRFLKGEQSDADLFAYVTDALETFCDDVSERTFVEMVIFVHILSRLGYVDVARIPEVLYDKAPHLIAEHYSPQHEQVIEQLYTHASAVSHL